MYRLFIFSFSVLILARLHAGFIEDWERLKKAQPEGYLCGRTTAPIKVDGKLDEQSWVKVPWTREFQDIEGPAKPAPRFKTRAKMLWDDQYFYIAAELLEPHVWGTLTNHDAVIFQDPDFEVFIDPDGDRHQYYEFEMNVLNTGWDLRLVKPYIDGGPALNEWEIPGLKTAVHIQGTLNNPADKDTGWSLEIAIPWKALGEFSRQKAPPAEGDVWRVDFSRVAWQIEIKNGQYTKVPGTKEDNWIWSPPGIVDMHRPENWGFVKFVSKVTGEFKPGRDAAADTLLGLYYAQKDFHKKNNRWATMKELGMNVPELKIKETPDGYEATYRDRSIRHDGFLK